MLIWHESNHFRAEIKNETCGQEADGGSNQASKDHFVAKRSPLEVAEGTLEHVS